MALLLGASYVPAVSPAGGAEAALMLMRWIHLIAGVIWIGLLYFFVLVNSKFIGELEPNTRTTVIAKLMPRAMWWFRWSSLITVLAGFAYWNNLVASDARAAAAVGEKASPGAAIGSFLVIWTVAFMIEMGLVMSPVAALKKTPVLGIIMAIVLLAAAYVFLTLNQNGWESNRTLCIGIGGGLGWFMMFNVWGIVWRMQKKLIRWSAAALADGSPIPPEAAKYAQISSLVAGISFWVSFPMMFFMGAASHYTLFVQS
jgi:uncharacterized membrane protein